MEKRLERAKIAKTKFKAMSIAKQSAVILRWGGFDAWYDQLEVRRIDKQDLRNINKLLASKGSDAD